MIRTLPNDPALTAPDPGSGVVEWALAREGFYDAWNITHGDGALVGVIDTGIDASHPDLAGKIAVAVDQQDPSDARGTAQTDEVGHGTHVASLACADTDNGIGMAGAGYDCRLVIEKSDFSDSSIAAAIVDATDRGVAALNMSFGPDSPSNSPPAPDSEVRALDYAASHKVVLVAAAADSPGSEQGDPANVLQPDGTGPNIAQGIGLDVTAAAYDGTRASFAGSGSEISLAAFGALASRRPRAARRHRARAGIFGAFPANSTDLESLPQPCGCRTTFEGEQQLRIPPGHIDGGPAGRGRGGDDARAESASFRPSRAEPKPYASGRLRCGRSPRARSRLDARMSAAGPRDGRGCPGRDDRGGPPLVAAAGLCGSRRRVRACPAQPAAAPGARLRCPRRSSRCPGARRSRPAGRSRWRRCRT